MSAPDSSQATSPYVVARAVVCAVERVSPTFVRVTFGGRDLDDFGTPGAVLDQRIKIIFPSLGRALPEFPTGDWYAAWLAIPEEERGTMRTYSVRDIDVEPGGTHVVVDFVLHLAPGLTGPAALWASTASVADELLLIGPRRGHTGGGGIEFAPGEAQRILLAGDETAAPAIARILEDVDRDVLGTAFIEVPQADDILPIAAPPGFDVRWLVRGAKNHGEVLIPSVLEHLGDDDVVGVEIRDVDTEELLWETPQFSGLGETLDAAPAPHSDRYFWIAGESGVVTTLRRHLVKDLGIDRSQVAFMGYWRRGVAMRG